MRRSERAALALALLLLVMAPVARLHAQQTPGGRGITAEDYYSFEFLSDPRISPDGRWVAYVVTTVDQRQNRRQSNVWITATDGSRPPRQFTTSAQSSSSPRWSPDGQQLAFLSARPAGSESPAAPQAAATPSSSPTPTTAATSQSAGAPSATPTPGGLPSALQTASAPPADAPRAQVYVLPLDGGEASRVTNLKNGVSTFQWSPDGRALAVISRVGPSDLKAPSSDVRHYKNSSFKFNDTGWFDDKRNHIWVVDVRTGDAKQITSGEDWNDSDPQWSPDGRRIAFVSDRTGRAFEESRNTDVWVVSADGTGPLTKISDHEEADQSPRFSPDGKWIAFTGSVRERDHPKIWLAPSAGGAPSQLAAAGLDLIPTNLRWAEAGRALLFEAGARGELHLFRVDVATKNVKQITKGARAVRSADSNDSARLLAYTANDFKKLDDLYVADLSGANERRLTRLNAKLWSRLRLQDVERFTYKGADDFDIDAFLVKPLDWEMGKKYPMILSIHGGPAAMYGVDWFHEFQVYAARGWAVLYTNPRGSTGYGQRFERAIEGEWGGKDYVDVMKGVEAALARHPWIDRGRLGVTGGSYGGYLTNWIVGKTDIFKAAVTLRSISNFVSDEGTRDGAYGHTPDFGGDLFEKFDLYWERSPLKYVKNVKTPILILHADNDHRVPLEQAEQWFRALRHFGAPTELVIFPRDNHNLTRTGEPKHLVESLNWQNYWFERYLDGNGRAIPPNAR